MLPICFYIFEDATVPHILLSYATSERLGHYFFSGPQHCSHNQNRLCSTPTPSNQRKTTKCVTFWDPIMKTAGSSTSTNAPASHHGKTKTASLKGEEPLTSSLSKTTESNNEVKVGSFNHSRTQKCILLPNSPSSKTIRHSTLANFSSPMALKPILHHPEV